MTLPILTDPIVPNRALWDQGLAAYQSTTADVLGATLRETIARNPTPGLVRSQGRFEEDAAAQAALPGATRWLDPDEATERWGIPGELAFKAPLSEFSARETYHLKRDELARRSVLGRGGDGFVMGAMQLGVGLAGSILDPLNIASAFVPVVPQARMAIMMARAETATARAAVRARIGAIEGAAGAALLEPLVAGLAAGEQADYTLMDSFLNLTFGTALGGGLHALGGAIGDISSARAARAVPDTNEPMNAQSSAARRSADLALEPDPIARPADLGPRELSVDEAGLRAALADLVDRGSVRNAEVAVRNEIERLRNAYGEVLARPAGDAMEPAVTIAPGDIASAIIARGGWGGLGDVSIQDAGWGLVKFIWKHGEASERSAVKQVTQQNVLDFPRIVREMSPARDSIEVDETTGQWTKWEYRLPNERTGGSLIYAVKRFTDETRPFGDGQARVVTIIADARSPEKLGKPLSEPRLRPGSPDPVLGQVGDTAAPQYPPVAQGRAASPAPRNLGAPEPERNLGAERANEAAARPVATDAQARRQEADEAASLAEADLARALDAAGPEAKAAVETELAAIREVGEEGAALERAAVAAAACLRGN